MQLNLSEKAKKTLFHAWRTDPIKVEFDKGRGVPVVDYGLRYGIRIGQRINPLTIALFVCKDLHLEHITGSIFLRDLSEARGTEFLNEAAVWLRRLEKQSDGFSFWEYDFPWPAYPNLTLPWKSALTEAFGALALLQLGYQKEALKHIRSLLVPFDHGGVSLQDRNSLWFLEYACQNPPLVLNGMLHCLNILHEFTRRFDDKELKDAFELAYRTMVRGLRQFDAGFYTLYDSYGNPADLKYHRLHVELLKLIDEKRPDFEVRVWVSRWDRFLKTYPYFQPIILTKHLIQSRGALFRFING